MPQTLTAPFRRAVLGLNGGPTDALVVKLGCQLAKPYKADLIALHVVEVDWTHDLSEDVASDNEQASSVLDLAEGIAEKFQVTLQCELLQARDVGAAIVDEATELHADLVILGLAYRKKFGGDFALGRTVPYVLQNAPCQVFVVREPIATSEARGAERETAVGAAVGAADRI
jgi:nucleotide-binding universal stress UspA family protein